MNRSLGMVSLAAAILVSAPATPAEPTSRLAPIPSPVSIDLDDAVWFSTGEDYLVTPTAIDADEIAQAMITARHCFSRRFNAAAPPGAVMTTGAVGLFEALPENRRGWVLPWNFDRSGASREARSHEQSKAEAASSIQHELGHLFLLHALLPNVNKPQYGGDAPDWLDEAAGVALESPSSRADRRRRFAALVDDGRLTPFSTFVSQAHPVFASQRLQAEVARARAASPDQPIVLEFTLAELGLTSTSADDFYAQTSAVIDFLDSLEKPDALGLIARDIQQSGAPLGWIARLGADVGMATSEDWDRRFEAWSSDADDAPSPNDCRSSPL